MEEVSSKQKEDLKLGCCTRVSSSNYAVDEVVEESWRQRLGEQVGELDGGGHVVKPNVLLLDKFSKVIKTQTNVSTALVVYRIFALGNTCSVVFENPSWLNVWESQFV